LKELKRLFTDPSLAEVRARWAVASSSTSITRREIKRRQVNFSRKRSILCAELGIVAVCHCEDSVMNEDAKKHFAGAKDPAVHSLIRSPESRSEGRRFRHWSGAHNRSETARLAPLDRRRTRLCPSGEGGRTFRHLRSGATPPLPDHAMIMRGSERSENESATAVRGTSGGALARHCRWDCRLHRHRPCTTYHWREKTSVIR